MRLWHADFDHEDRPLIVFNVWAQEERLVRFLFSFKAIFWETASLRPLPTQEKQITKETEAGDMYFINVPGTHNIRRVFDSPRGHAI